MFSMNPDSKMRGPGYIILNVLRVFNIISLITVVVASWVMLVRTVQTSNVWDSYFVLQIVISLLTTFTVLLLRRGLAFHHEHHWDFPHRFRAHPLQILLCA